jgi:3-dehydroquinate dehydratase type I
VSFKVCAVITGRDLNTVKTMIKRAESSKADLIEVRFDYASKPYSPHEVRKATALPLIATNRQSSDDSKQNLRERWRTLLSSAEAGFEYVDMELHTLDLKDKVKRVKRQGSKPIISYHDYSSMPPTASISKIWKEEVAAGAEICKIVGTACDIKDNLVPLSFLSKVSRKFNTVSFCMGKYGVASRLLAPLFGAYFTYASVSRGQESASGQLTVREMKKIYNTWR